jgi:hypothetical protein
LEFFARLLARFSILGSESDMKITAFTVLICLFAVISLVSLLRRLRRDGLGFRSALIWAVLWLSIAVFSVFPDLLNELMEAAGMENRLFFLLVIAVLVLSALVFNLTSRIDRLSRDVGLAVRELAIIAHRVAGLAAEQRTVADEAPARSPPGEGSGPTDTA